MFYKGRRTGISHNFTIDVDPGYKYIEKLRGGVQWYMMESRDIISSISFKLKNEINQQVSFNGSIKNIWIINQVNLRDGYIQIFKFFIT